MISTDCKRKIIWIKNYIFFPFLTALVLIYFFKVSNGTYPGAVLNSQDMQWFGSFEFWAGFDPYYQDFIAKVSYKAQAPNYGHLLYIVMYPFAILDPTTAASAWAFLNFFCFLLSFSIFYFDKNIPRGYTLLASWLLLHGYCYSNVINNGQFALVAVALLTCAWRWRSQTWVLTPCLALLFTKYSFGLPIMLGFFLAGYYKGVIYAIAVNIIAIYIYTLRFDIGFIDTFLMPLQIAYAIGSIGPSDLMSLGRMMGSNIGKIHPTLVIFFIIYFLFSYICLKYKKYLNDGSIIASSITLSLSTFFHMGYDHLIMIVPLLIIVDSKKLILFRFLILLLLSTVLWSMNRVYSVLKINPPGAVSMSMGIEHSIILIAIITFVSFLLLFIQIYSGKHKLTC